MVSPSQHSDDINQDKTRKEFNLPEHGLIRRDDGGIPSGVIISPFSGS
jgi:hypothetical protein